MNEIHFKQRLHVVTCIFLMIILFHKSILF